MILIISDESDVSTNKVIDYFIKNNQEFNVMTNEDFMNYCSILIESNSVEIEIETSSKTVNSRDIKSYWYRRGGLKRKFRKLNDNFIGKAKEGHLLNEWKFVQNFIYKYFESLNGIGSFEKSNSTGKINNLFYATVVGFKIPSTFITNKKKALSNFFDKHKSVITKSIERDLKHFKDRKKLGVFGTRKITTKEISLLNDFEMNYHSFLQNLVEKDFEIRTFYLKEKMWSMAIFSQRDSQTSIDFRNYNIDKPNRMIPYNHSKSNEDKIKNFMELAKLE